MPSTIPGTKEAVDPQLQGHASLHSSDFSRHGEKSTRKKEAFTSRGGVGDLPGRPSESNVALLPDERQERHQGSRAQNAEHHSLGKKVKGAVKNLEGNLMGKEGKMEEGKEFEY